MAARRTRVTLSIPWDDEEHDHPAGWDFEGLLSIAEGERYVHVIQTEEVDELGNLLPQQ